MQPVLIDMPDKEPSGNFRALRRGLLQSGLPGNEAAFDCFISSLRILLQVLKLIGDTLQVAIGARIFEGGLNLLQTFDAVLKAAV